MQSFHKNSILWPTITQSPQMQSHDVEMKELIEEEELEFEYYEGGLNPVVGWPEWKALIAVFECVLTWLPMVDWDLCIYCGACVY